MDTNKLAALNADVKAHGAVDRSHLLSFLQLQTNSDGEHLVQAVRSWLQGLHDDPTYEKVQFLRGDIDAIIGDLDSYGRVQAETILSFKNSSSHEMSF
jgi:hypothetical protein